jgi:hypothetical protein
VKKEDKKRLKLKKGRIPSNTDEYMNIVARAVPVDVYVQQMPRGFEPPDHPQRGDIGGARFREPVV